MVKFPKETGWQAEKSTSVDKWAEQVPVYSGPVQNLKPVTERGEAVVACQSEDNRAVMDHDQYILVKNCGVVFRPIASM